MHLLEACLVGAAVEHVETAPCDGLAGQGHVRVAEDPCALLRGRLVGNDAQVPMSLDHLGNSVDDGGDLLLRHGQTNARGGDAEGATR